jgi:Domain of unknown function (DUF3883)
MRGPDWNDVEIDLIVADYFQMLTEELAGVDYNKSAHRRDLLAELSRPKGAIEFKHQNISAILLGLGYPWIEGYKPASNYQAALLDGVVRYLNAKPAWIEPVFKAREKTVDPILRENQTLWIGPPPTHSNLPPAIDLVKAKAVAEKFDVAERDARNRKLGLAGEERVFQHERSLLNSAGRDDLARKVRWVSQEDGDGAGFDILSFDQNGGPRLIEVKTTNGWERTPFHITRNELNVANENRDSWNLIRLWNFAKEPKAYEIRPPLERYVELTPTSFLASLN